MTTAARAEGGDPSDRQMPRAVRLFSTPFEVGLRAAYLLEALARHGAAAARLDARRLVIYDYLLVHSGDVEGGPASLHPATPHRSGELLVKRDLMRDGLMLFVGRELLRVHLDAAGVTFTASDLTETFLRYLEAPYATRLRETASWVVQRFAEFSDAALEAYVAAHLGRWGGEFSAEALVRGVPT
jgi:hypothetical protein